MLNKNLSLVVSLHIFGTNGPNIIWSITLSSSTSNVGNSGSWTIANNDVGLSSMDPTRSTSVLP